MPEAKILIVEGEAILALDIQSRLSNLDYPLPDVVHSGEDAFSKATQTHPDLILMDIKLPGRIDGIQAAAQISASLDVPIIFVTAFADEEALQRAKITEPFGYIVKPVQERELLAAIEMALYKHAAEARLRKLNEELEQHVKERTAELQTVKEWQTTFDSISDWVSVHDKDFKILRINRAFAEALKMDPEAIIGRPCYEVIHGEQGPSQSCPHRTTLETRQPSRREFFNPHLGIHMEVLCSPIFNDNGEAVSTVHIARDITERKMMEAQLISQDRLASIGQLVSGIAHELNNPLTGVIGFSDLLMERDLPADVKEDLGAINREARRTANIVRGLLTFARRQKTEKEPVQLNSVIQEVLQLRSYDQKVNNIEVEANFAPDLPQLSSNHGQLQQVFINIIINAEQAMLHAHGRGKLTITTTLHGDNIRASVADDGPGISPENMGKIFAPFFTTKEVGKGTGLGLSICHGIVNEHGGRIYAESEPGKGATFILELPVIK